MAKARVVATVAICALLLLLFVAFIGSDAPEPVAPVAQGSKSAVEFVPFVPTGTTMTKGDVHKDFGSQFAEEHAEELRRWLDGSHASDPLDGARPMSRADRTQVDPTVKFDKFDVGMLEGKQEGQQSAGKAGMSAKSGMGPEKSLAGGREERAPIDLASLIEKPKMRPPPASLANPSSEWGVQLSETCYLPPEREGCAPHFLIAGAMKCGTTSLHTYLLNHPQILPLKPNAKLNGKSILANKEVRFFNDPLYTSLVKKSGVQSAIEQYLDLFQHISPPSPRGVPAEPGSNEGMITGEASPMYICTRFAGERAKAALPYAKVILMLRDPVDRAYSEFWFRQSLTKSPLKNKPAGARANEAPAPILAEEYNEAFEACVTNEMMAVDRCSHELLGSRPTMEVVDQFTICYQSELNQQRQRLAPDGEFCLRPENSLVCSLQRYRRFCTGNNVKNGLYAHQVLEWVQAFAADQLLVIRSEDFYADTVRVMQQVEEFLGLDTSLHFDWAEVTGTAYNIVNPGTPSATGKTIVTQNPGLKVGGSDSDNAHTYPEVDPAVRRRLQKWFEPHNRTLEQILGKSMW